MQAILDPIACTVFLLFSHAVLCVLFSNQGYVPGKSPFINVGLRRASAVKQQSYTAAGTKTKGRIKVLTHKGTVEIKTERLLLRRFTLDEAQPMFDRWANDERVSRYLTWDPHGAVEITKMLVEAWCSAYEKPDNYNWAIELDGEVIGSISVVRTDERSERMDLGYCMGTAWWGKGIMTEAAGAVIDFLFAEVGCNRVEIDHLLANPASGRVAQKCGLTKEGVRREYFNKNGVFHDEVIYGIVRKEWLAAGKGLST